MSDGRSFTDYRPQAVVYSKPVTVSSHEVRQSMMYDGEIYTDSVRSNLNKEIGWKGCANTFSQGTMLPEQYMVECNGNTCKTVSINAMGLGTGRSYGPSTVDDPLQVAFLKAKEAQRFTDVKPEDRLRAAYGNTRTPLARNVVPSGKFV